MPQGRGIRGAHPGKKQTFEKATGRFCTRFGAILDVQTAVVMQDEIEGPDERFSTLLQDEDVQKLLMKKMLVPAIGQPRNGLITHNILVIPR